MDLKITKLIADVSQFNDRIDSVENRMGNRELELERGVDNIAQLELREKELCLRFQGISVLH